MSAKADSGTCLCGAVTVKVKAPSEHFGACHCNTCRRWSGGPLLAVDCGSDVSIDGMPSVSIYNSSSWAERGFCKTCGTHLFYRLKDGKKYILPIGFLKNGRELTFGHQIFVDEKPEHYAFANSTKNMTGPELFAQFAPKN